VHDPAMPGHVLRQAHIHRQQAPGPPIHDHQLRSLSTRPTRQPVWRQPIPRASPCRSCPYTRADETAATKTAPVISATATARWVPSVGAEVGG
jgi:hypothetical protein